MANKKPPTPPKNVTDLRPRLVKRKPQLPAAPAENKPEVKTTTDPLGSLASLFDQIGLQRQDVLQMAENAGEYDKDIARWKTAFDGLNEAMQKNVRFETVCRAVSLPTKQFFGAIVAEFHSTQDTISMSKVKKHLPKVIDDTASFAADVLGVRDRTNLLKAGGLIRGTQITVSAQATANAASQSNMGVPQFAQDISPVMDDVRKIEEQMLERQDQMLLEAGNEQPIDVAYDGHESHCYSIPDDSGSKASQKQNQQEIE